MAPHNDDQPQQELNKRRGQVHHGTLISEGHASYLPQSGQTQTGLRELQTHKVGSSDVGKILTNLRPGSCVCRE